jgi:hypothetical protein
MRLRIGGFARTRGERVSRTDRTAPNTAGRGSALEWLQALAAAAKKKQPETHDVRA